MITANEWGELPYAYSRRIRTIIPAEPGWRTLNYYSATVDEAKTKPLAELMSLEPVIAWALVEDASGGDIYTSIEPVVAEDFPSRAWLQERYAGVLEPGEELDEDFREGAVSRARGQQARAEEPAS